MRFCSDHSGELERIKVILRDSTSCVRRLVCKHRLKWTLVGEGCLLDSSDSLVVDDSCGELWADSLDGLELEEAGVDADDSVESLLDEDS